VTYSMRTYKSYTLDNFCTADRLRLFCFPSYFLVYINFFFRNLSNVIISLYTHASGAAVIEFYTVLKRNASPAQLHLKLIYSRNKSNYILYIVQQLRIIYCIYLYVYRHIVYLWKKVGQNLKLVVRWWSLSIHVEYSGFHIYII